MAKDKAEEMLDEVLQAARKPGPKGGHSPVYEFLWTHHDRLVSELGPPRSPNWPEIAATLGKLGVLDATGKAPAPATVRNAWWRVCKDKASAGTKQRKPRGRTKPQPAQAGAVGAPAPSAPTTPPKRQAAPTTPADDDDDLANFITPLRRSWEK